MIELWLPRDFIEREQQQLASRGPSLPILRVALGYEELLGAKPSWDDLFGRLHKYTLPQILGTLGRISGVLEQLDRKHVEAQKRICDGLLVNRRRDVWQRLIDWIKGERDAGRPESEPVLFHDLQLITFAKIAFLRLDPVVPLEGTAALEALAEALLMLTNLQRGVLGSNPGVDASTPEGERIWHQHFIANGLFHHNDTEVHALPRFYDLYLTDKPQLRAHPSYVDLPARVRHATGLEPEVLWSILFAIMAHWRNLDLEAIANGIWVMDRTQYFRNYRFTADELENFFALVATDIEAMKREIVRAYSDDLQTFHVLPFAKWPLVHMGKYVFCVSVKLLKQKLTSGLHHLYLDEEKSPDMNERRRYLNYMGAVFEDYVGRLLDRVFPPRTNRCLKPEILAEACGSGKSCDFAVLYGDAIVLVETKAVRFTLGARTESSWPEYQRQFEDIFIDGARQISSTIEAIESGRLAHLGIDPNAVRAYYPLIVTLEDLPMHPVIYRKVREEIGAKGILRQQKARPLQAIDIGELEFFEIGLHSGRSLRDILEEKVRSADTADESMSNYLIARREPFITGPVNQHLGDLFNTLGDRAADFFRKTRHENLQGDEA